VLERVQVTDFAVARRLDLALGPGLTVFTGETGAGKSLVVDALAFAFGARRGREVIASGAERATVTVTVTSDTGATTIERSISLNGRSVARVNGDPATVEQLQELGGRHVDLHGQSEQLTILRPATQLAVLDAFAGLEAERQDVASLAAALRDTRRRLRGAIGDSRERERLTDQLRFELDEIRAAAPVSGEDVDLQDERVRLSSVGRLRTDADSALLALDEPALGEIARATGEIGHRDPGARDVADAAAALEAALADLRRVVRRYRDRLEEDPGRLAAVEERLDRLARLRRKYGDSLDEVIAYAASAAARLDELEGAAESVESLRSRETTLVHELASAAGKLSLARRAHAGDLVSAIARELEALGMAGATLSVGFGCDDDPDGVPVRLPDYEVVITEREPGGEGEPLRRAFTETGVDRVEFLASFNAGETPRPLASVASGGETSRFLLALTTVLGSAAAPKLVVFDEVDEGVGGRAGALVGEALSRLAVRHQVVCITHLPQVAAFGKRHFVVSKQSDDSRTWSEVRQVDGSERVDELAAMLGGVSEGTRKAARDLLNRAAGSAASN
jgi:DNA repair protein RecN (Recombination protein N)